MSWLSDFYQRHPEYRRLRIAKRSRGSIHFEIEPGRYEAHFLTRPLFERAASGLWLPVSNLAQAVRMGIALSHQPRLAWELAKALPFATSPLTLQPDAAAGLDTSVYQGSPTFNYGITTTIFSGAYNTLGTQKIRGLLQFDISSLPVGATLTAATLTLYLESVFNATSVNIEARRGLTQWYEGAKNGAAPDVGQDGSNWNYRNANGNVAWAGGAGGGSGSDWSASITSQNAITNVTGAYNWDVLTDVNAWYGGTATNYGHWFRSSGEANLNTVKLFTSSDGATAGNRPKLVITYTLPATARSWAVIVG